jgi:hypothetical protein
MSRITILPSTHEERFNGETVHQAHEVWAVHNENDQTTGLTIVIWWDGDVWVYPYPFPKSGTNDRKTENRHFSCGDSLLTAQLRAIELLGGNDDVP